MEGAQRFGRCHELVVVQVRREFHDEPPALKHHEPLFRFSIWFGVGSDGVAAHEGSGLSEHLTHVLEDIHHDDFEQHAWLVDTNPLVIGQLNRRSELLSQANYKFVEPLHAVQQLVQFLLCKAFEDFTAFQHTSNDFGS